MWEKRRSGVVKVVAAALALCAYWACKDDPTRPGVVGDCGDECADPLPPLNPGGDSSSVGGSAGASGTGGGSGSAGSAGSAAVLAGSIRAVVATDLTDDVELDGAVKVRAPGTSSEQVTVNSELDGTFRLEGITRNANLWVGVGPFSNDAASFFVDTLQVVNSSVSAPVELLAVHRAVLEQLATSFLDNPLEIDPARGAVILRFVNQQRRAIVGVSLLVPDPAQTSVAYDLGDTYSDQVTETSDRGTLILMNLSTSPYPGAATTIAAEVAGMRRDVDVHTAAGAVTLITAVMP